jgi:hypothetical protein
MSKSKISFSDLPIEIIDKISKLIDYPLHLLNNDLYHNLDKKVLTIGSIEDTHFRPTNKVIITPKNLYKVIINSSYKARKITLQEGLQKLVINVDIRNKNYHQFLLDDINLPNSIVSLKMKNWYPVFPILFPKNLKKLTVEGIINLIYTVPNFIIPQVPLLNNENWDKEMQKYRKTANFFKVPNGLTKLKYKIRGKNYVQEIESVIIFNDDLEYLSLDILPQSNKFYTCNHTLEYLTKNSNTYHIKNFFSRLPDKLKYLEILDDINFESLDSYFKTNPLFLETLKLGQTHHLPQQRNYKNSILIPPNLKYLYLGVSDQNTHELKLTDKLEICIYYGGGYIENYLPETLRILRISDLRGISIIPDSVEEITIDKSTHDIILGKRCKKAIFENRFDKKVLLNDKLEILELGNSFNSEINLNKNLKFLYIGSTFNQPLKLNKNLVRLDISMKTWQRPYPKAKFNSTLILNEGLKYLRISSDFNEDLTTPKSLKRLTLRNKNYTANLTLNEGLELLDIDSLKYEKETKLELPDSLKILFGKTKGLFIKDTGEENNLPKNIQVLSKLREIWIDKFNRPIWLDMSIRETPYILANHKILEANDDSAELFLARYTSKDINIS